jgi:alpha-ribazole phosphatase
MTTVTSWWFVRHAPVIGVEGKIYGSDDVECDVSDTASFKVLAGKLPSESVWMTSHLTRAKLTARSIAEAGLKTPDPVIEADLGEQDFGRWQGSSWQEMEDGDPEGYAKFWETPASSAPPGGESFADLIARTGAVMDRYTESHAGRDIVAVCHGGPIRAAIAHALRLSPEMGMSFSVGTLSMTRLEHVEGGLLRGQGGVWRIVGINQPSSPHEDGVIR